MKVAVCLSGQMRYFRECYPNIYQYIIEPNKADVFIHSWYDTDNLEVFGYDPERKVTLSKGADKELIELYQPKAWLIEKPKTFYNSKIVIPPCYRNRTAIAIRNRPDINLDIQCMTNVYSMYYSIMKCNELKEIYAFENNSLYDAVIKLRFDTNVSMPVLCEEYDMDYFYYADLNHPDSILSDWINMGSNQIMNIYASTFLHIEYLNHYKYFTKEHRIPNTLYYTESASWGSEHILRDIMTLFQIPSLPMRERYSLYRC
jgi:hypothetical protein